VINVRAQWCLLSAMVKGTDLFSIKIGWTRKDVTVCNSRRQSRSSFNLVLRR